MKHKWLRNFDADGKWCKPERKISVDGVEHDLDDYAKQHGIVLPDAKKAKKTQTKINIDIQEKQYADMEQALDSGDTEIDGAGDSEGSE